MNHKQIPISSEAYSVIWALFNSKLKVHSSLSCPEGSPESPSQCRMMTEWGIDGEPLPLIGNNRKWERNPATGEQTNVEQTYWLCSAQEEY